MKDFFNSPVEVGDTVVFMVKNYRSLMQATVIKVTDKTILVEYSATWDVNYKLTYRLTSDQFIVIEQGRVCKCYN